MKRKLFVIPAILIVITSSTIFFIYHIQKDVSVDPYRIVSEYIDDIVTGNYEEACSILISSEGKFLMDTDPERVGCLVEDLEHGYGPDGYGPELFNSSRIRITHVCVEKNKMFSIYTYNIFINFSGIIRSNELNYSINLDVIEFTDQGSHGILINNSESISEMVNILPIHPDKDDIRLEVSSSINPCPKYIDELWVNLTLINDSIFPLILEDFSIGRTYKWTVQFENGSSFSPKFRQCLPMPPVPEIILHIGECNLKITKLYFDYYFPYGLPSGNHSLIVTYHTEFVSLHDYSWDGTSIESNHMDLVVIDE